MNEKLRELIAVGASVGAHCHPCLAYHVARARELGIEDSEIREAIAVGHQVEKGAMAAMRRFSTDVMADGRGNDGGCCPGGPAPGCCG